MTPEQILAQLANGMHDASIQRMMVEFGAQRAILDMEFWVGDLDAEDEDRREEYRAGRLVLSGVEAVVVDPPDLADRGAAFSVGDGVSVHGEFGTCPGDPPAPDDGEVRLWFFVGNWNRWMKFTACECALEWT